METIRTMSPFCVGDTVQVSPSHRWAGQRRGQVKSVEEDSDRYIVKFSDSHATYTDEDGDHCLRLCEKDLMPVDKGKKGQR